MTFNRARYDAERITAAILWHHADPMPDPLSRCKTEACARARKLVAYIMHAHLGYNFSEIGRALERNHATVIYGIRTIAEHAAIYDDVGREYAELCRRLNLWPHPHMTASKKHLTLEPA